MSEPADSFDEVPGLEPSGTEAHLSDYWVVVVKHRRLIVVCVLVALVAGALVTYLSERLFQGTVVVDVVRRTSSSLSLGLAGSVPVDGALEFLPSQVELLGSRDVAERVVKRLNLLSNPEFRAAYPYLKGPPLVSSPGKPARPPSAREITSAALAVQSDADANVVKATSLVRVTFQAPTPKLAADVANGIADAYIEWNIESRFRQIAQSAQFLATQIEEAKRDIEEKEKAMLVYARQKDIILAPPKATSTEDSGMFNRDYALAVADRVDKETRYQELQNSPAEAVAEKEAGGLLAQLRSDQSKLERDYADKLNLYKPEWPAMLQLKSQVEEGRQRLNAAIRDTSSRVREAAHRDYLLALRRETSMQTVMRSKQSEAINQAASSSEYNNLRVEIDTKRALLDTLLRQQGEAEVLSRLREEQATNIRIVDRALAPHRPFKPSIGRNMAIATVLGLGLGLGLAFLLTYLDRTLQTPEEIERYVQLPPLGSVPLVGHAAKARWWKRRGAAEATSGPQTAVELLPHEQPRSAIAEAYRAFRTSLLFSRAGGVGIVAVTSVLPREGKSATAANLAIVLAQLGRRVLLIDADLHRSGVHKLFGVSKELGLVSILAEGVEPSRVIVKTKVPGVFVVPAGPETPNPSALLSSENMRRFLELAASNFDHVVIDTPPVLATSDVLVFGQHTDGVVLCVRAGVTPRDQVREVRDKLLRGGVPILGVLLNGRRLDPSYYEYRYLNYGERQGAAEDSEARKPVGQNELETPRGRGVISEA